MTHDVSVWVIELRIDGWRERFDPWLSPAESARRDRFYFERDQQEFTVCRGTLRQVLSQENGCLPGEVRFREGPYGKPHLHDDAVAFNVSHSGDLALIALTHLPAVGVDIERERTLSDRVSLARGSFSVREQRALEALPPGLRDEGFFRCWSRKEAFIKAIGMGLSFPLQDFDVSLDPRHPAQLLEVRDEEQRRVDWVLRHLDIAPGYSAALVTPGLARVQIVRP